MISPQLPLAVQLRESASFASYHPGPNAVAVNALLTLQGPLLLYGPPGSGRTHLLQALCRERGAAYLPLADLAALGPEAIDGYAGAPGACLDDVDAVGGDDGWCIALLRLIDALRARGAPLVAATTAPPERLALARVDLRTRLAGFAAFGLRLLGDDDRRALLLDHALRRGLSLPDEVARWLVNTQSREVGHLLDALERLDRASLSAKRRLTLPFVQAVLAGP